MDDNGWLEWEGGPCPVEPRTEVSVYFRDGRHLTRVAGVFSATDTGEDYWQHQTRQSRDHIVRYRLTDQALLAAFQRTDGEPGDPVSDALLAEIERRNLDI